MRLALLLVAVFVAGCAAPERLAGLGSGEAVPPPYFQEYRATVTPQQSVTYSVAVADRAVSLNATIHLAAIDGGTGALPVAPARLTLTLLDAAGVPLANATVEPSQPDASILIESFASRGLYEVLVRGTGLAYDVEGTGYGAAYTLTVEVIHG